jgi:hypothetical protein
MGSSERYMPFMAYGLLCPMLIVPFVTSVNFVLLNYREIGKKT